MSDRIEEIRKRAEAATPKDFYQHGVDRVTIPFKHWPALWEVVTKDIPYLLARIEELEALAGPDCVRMFDGQVAARMKLLKRIMALEEAGDGLTEHLYADHDTVDGRAGCGACAVLAAWEKAKAE